MCRDPLGRLRCHCTLRTPHRHVKAQPRPRAASMQLKCTPSGTRRTHGPRGGNCDQPLRGRSPPMDHAVFWAFTAACYLRGRSKAGLLCFLARRVRLITSANKSGGLSDSEFGTSATLRTGGIISSTARLTRQEKATLHWHGVLPLSPARHLQIVGFILFLVQTRSRSPTHLGT